MAKDWNRRVFLRSSVAGAGATVALGSEGAHTASATPGASADASREGGLRIDRTTVEYAETLLGTEVEHPRLTWESTAPGRGARQSAYRVRVALTEKDLREGAAPGLGLGAGRVGPQRRHRLRGARAAAPYPLPLAGQGLGRRRPSVGVERPALVGDNVANGRLAGILDRGGGPARTPWLRRGVLDLVARLDHRFRPRRAPLVPYRDHPPRRQ
ncbi:hypothetical protein ACH4PR_26065 [Streptomyces mirabilis]|uniref:glycoside hydrolase family 78 protein n=1 Tax=Streptomyces mirabilis TaxID=68239 RepID=UPI00379AAEEF